MSEVELGLEWPCVLFDLAKIFDLAEHYYFITLFVITKAGLISRE